jgi:hypothetical protein
MIGHGLPLLKIRSRASDRGDAAVVQDYSLTIVVVAVTVRPP